MKPIEKIDIIARKESSRLTKADKELVKEMSEELGIPFTPRPRCADCYSDQAIIIRKALMEKESTEAPGREYILKAGVDVIFMGQRINNDTLTDEIAEDIVSKGFAKYLFAKCK